MASSASKLVPSDPEKVMVIRKLTPDITICSSPFKRFGRVKIGGRGTIVRLQTGNVAVFSPVALTEAVKSETQSLGNVKYLVAPDQEHHIFIEEWHKAYPEASVIGPETLPELRKKQGYFPIPAALWKPFVANKPLVVSEEFDNEFHSEYVHAHQNKELVFCHRPSGTLIEADLLFNLPATEQMSKSGESAETGVLTKIFNSLQNTHGEAKAQKRMLWYAMSAVRRQ